MRFQVFIAIILSAWAMSCENKDIFENPPEPYSCEQSECWDEAFYVCRDNFYNNFFTRTSEWTGGDATYSTELGTGRRLWMFGDTFIDQVNSDGSRPSFRLINNSLVIQEGEEFTTYYQGSRSNPQSFIQPVEENWWYWPADGTVSEDTLYLFMHGFGNDSGGAWDFYRTSIDLAKLSPESLEVYSIERLSDSPTISWGAAIFEAADFVYIYGVLSEGISKTAYAARTTSISDGTWQYYDGTDWSEDETDAAPVFNDVSEQFSVFEQDGLYYLLNQHNLFGFEISLKQLSGPVGQVLDSRVIYCTPESVGDKFTYNALAHPDVYSDSLLISYNLNSFDFNDLLNDVNNYRPYFVRVGNWLTQ